MHRSVSLIPEMKTLFEQNPQYETACHMLAHAQPELAVAGWQEVRALLTAAATTMCFEPASAEDVLTAANVAANHLLATR
jgi:hypothetical protein